MDGRGLGGGGGAPSLPPDVRLRQWAKRPFRTGSECVEFHRTFLRGGSEGGPALLDQPLTRTDPVLPRPRRGVCRGVACGAVSLSEECCRERRAGEAEGSSALGASPPGEWRRDYFLDRKTTAVSVSGGGLKSRRVTSGELEREREGLGEGGRQPRGTGQQHSAAAAAPPRTAAPRPRPALPAAV